MFVYLAAKNKKMAEEQWGSEEEFDKAVGQFRLKLNSLLNPLRLYGQGVYVDQVTEELIHLGIQLHLRLYGVDIPYEVEDLHW